MANTADNPIKEALASLARLTYLFWEAMGSIIAKRFRMRDLVEQIHFIGVKSQSVVLLTGAFTGYSAPRQWSIPSRRPTTRWVSTRVLVTSSHFWLVL